MDANQFFVQQELLRAGAAARGAETQVTRATTLAEVKRFGQISLHPLVRPLRASIPEIRHLRQAQTDQARKLVEAQLAQMRKLLADTALEPAERLAKAKNLHGRWQQCDWIHLRGEQAGLLQYAMREAERMLSVAERSTR